MWSGLARPGRPLALFLFILILPALGIQVAPGSPCAALCIDDSSTTVSTDITCSDSDFNTTTAGIKWVSCMTCLQSSTHVQDNESDQSWFRYNLRYQVDYCIFGYPNASDTVGSNPCQTSTACLPLKNALFTGVPAMGSTSTSTSTGEYDYCSVDGHVLTSSSLKGCLDCISSSGNTDVVANSLIALEAGCIEQLPSSETLGLSGSIFATSTTVSIVTASSSSSSSSSSTAAASSSRAHHVTTTTIVVVAVVAALVVAAVAGFGFVCYRKRRGARNRAAVRRALERKTGALASTQSAVPSTVPVDWHSRFPSSEHISGPLHFHSPDDLPSRKAASPQQTGTLVAAETKTASAQKKKYKPQLQQTHAGSNGSNNNSNGTLPAIVESPFPSPAVHGAGAVGSLGMRIHSTDFDKQTDLPMASESVGSVSSLAPRRHPRLHQLKTSFGSADTLNTAYSAGSAVSAVSAGSAGYASTYDPSSATGLLSSSHYNYNYSPASHAASQRSSAYQHSPLRNDPPSASPASAIGGSVEHQLRIAARSLAHQYQQHPVYEPAHEPVQSQHASAYGSPASASSSRPASVNGIGSATMATSTTATTATRKSKSGPLNPFGRSGGSGSDGCSPVETRSIQTHFRPPPQQGRR